jgi:hypothetical protein
MVLARYWHPVMHLLYPCPMDCQAQVLNLDPSLLAHPFGPADA